MALKVFGGAFRGFPLKLPPEKIARPTSAMIHRKLFDRLQNLEGYVFYDLCAGSGLVGFEALSRGAAQVILNEIHPKVFPVLKSNFQTIQKKFPQFELDEKTLLKKGDCVRLLSDQKLKLSESSTIVYLDPPYDQIEIYRESLSVLSEGKFSGELWLHTDKHHLKRLDSLMNEWVEEKAISHGGNLVFLLSLKV